MGKKSKAPTPRQMVKEGLKTGCFDAMAVLVGRKKDGEISVVSSHNSADALYLLEAAKLQILLDDPNIVTGAEPLEEAPKGLLN
jgi:hypothetical protein